MKDFFGTGLTAGDLDGSPIDSYFSRSRKLHYVSTPKVACTSLKWWFARLEGCDIDAGDLRRSRETEPDLVVHDLLPLMCPGIVPGSREEELEIFNSREYFRFALVRNPYKRIFSAWQSKLLLHEPYQIAPYLACEFFTHPLRRLEDIASAFEGFLEYIAGHEWPNICNPHWAPQAQVLRMGKVSYSMIAQIENPQPLWDAVAHSLKQEDFESPLKTRTNESLIPYRPEFISGRSRELILQLYADDFEFFDYPEKLPDSREPFEQEQFDVAVKAIGMIQGRSRRFGEIRELLAEADKKVADLEAAHQAQNIELSRLSQSVSTVEAEKAGLGMELERLLSENDRLTGEIASVHSSLSYRLTAPFRWLCHRICSRP